MALLVVGLLLCFYAIAHATPYIWDEDGDHVDDRVESVNLLGYQFSFENGDTTERQRIAVTQTANGLAYSIYVIFDHPPTATDYAGLASIGMSVLHAYESLPAVRSAASWLQIQAAAALPGIERIEAVPVLHPMLHEATAAIGVRDPSGQVFPTWESSGGGAGEGVVIAFLDSGINDEADGGYPGHESLAGRCVGGATFVNGDSSLDTPRNGSVNPVDRGGALTQYHGTHVASIAMGGGGASGYAMGVAPAARFVDVKVLNDAGVGLGVAEALDWCIHNRARDWGGPAGFSGVDVINLSLSSVDQSDGNDLASRLADEAARRGIVVVASVGNDGESGHVPSPAGGDRVLVVGAFDDQKSALVGDDRFAGFSNYGPRADDGDLDTQDEQKPDLLAPGVSILAADGDLSTDGLQYKRLSGTSMSAALVTGAAASLLSSDPSLTPATLRERLRATASRQLAAVPVGQGGPDPRWYSPIGFGALDLYAARLEATQPQRSQIVRLDLSGAGSQIDAVLRTQREFDSPTFTIERAADQDGAPGAFTAYDAVAGTGDASLSDVENRRAYPRTWSIPPGERGATYWYRVSYIQDATTYLTPARPFVSPTGPSVATLELTIVHNAYDHDLASQVVAGSSSPGLRATRNGAQGGLVIPVPASGAAVSSEWVSGASATGNVAWTYHIEVPAGQAEAFLPPSAGSPWRLEVMEGGYLNRSGRITQFDLVWHSPSGDVRYEGHPIPIQTVEGQTAVASLPDGVLSVGDLASPLAPSFAPNPVRSGHEVTFLASAAMMGTSRGGALSIYDLGGREIGRAKLERAGSGYRARWTARGADGAALAPGIYFAALDPTQRARLVVLR